MNRNLCAFTTEQAQSFKENLLRIWTNHNKTCPGNTNGYCDTCIRLIKMCCYHANYCKETQCPIPYCSHIKIHLKKFGDQNEFNMGPLTEHEMKKRHLMHHMEKWFPHREKFMEQSFWNIQPLSIRLKCQKIRLMQLQRKILIQRENLPVMVTMPQLPGPSTGQVSDGTIGGPEANDEMEHQGIPSQKEPTQNEQRP